MNADTGVSRSPVMSKGACNRLQLQWTRATKNPSRGHPEMGCLRAVRDLESREKLTVSPLRYEVRHHHRREVLTGRCDICQRVSPWDARHVKDHAPPPRRPDRPCAVRLFQAHRLDIVAV